MNRRTLVVATKNKHKIEEIAAILGTDWTVKSATMVAPDISWDETGTTFTANARIKADALASRTEANMCILADDSGLEVDALGGAPGVYSSRYAGVEGDDAANNAKLLAALAAVPAEKRAAQFVCVLVYRDEAGKESVFRGECKGSIARAAKGQHGFGYDPLFIPSGYDRALAELSPEEKNLISHRRRALEHWLDYFTF